MEKRPRRTPAEKARAQYTNYAVKEPMELMEFLTAKMPDASRTKLKSLLSKRVVLVDNVITTQFNFPLKPGMKVQISKDTQDKGDRILAALESNSFISNDRFTGRFGAGLKAFFTECKDIEIVVNTINHINKENWNKYFTPIAGQSMEAKSYKEALTKLTEQIKK